MNGQVAESYGELIEKLWNGNAQSYTPRDFKYTIDGLHEDLNRIIKKPYIELPDFDGMKDKEIAERSWNYHRARNDSVIVDLFQGQFKSTLICAECKNVSVTFDPFMYLSLPLPIERKCKKTVVYVPYDPTQRMQRVVLTLNKDADIAQLQKEVAKIMSVKDASTLLVVEIFSHKIYKVFSHYEAVARIGNSDLIYVYQLPGPVPSISKKKAIPYRLYNHNEDVLDTVEAEDNNQLVVFPVYCATVEGHDTSSGQPQQFGNPFIVAVSRSDANNPDSLYHLLLQHVERYTHFKLFEEVDEEQTNDELPKDETVTNQAMDIDDQPQQQPIHTAAAVLAAGDKKTESTANLFTMKVFSGPRSYGKYTEELLPCSQSWSPSSLEDLRKRAEEEQRRREEYERQQNEPSEEEVENNDVEMKESTVLDSKTQGDTDDEDEVENAAAIFYQREPNAFAIDDDTVVSDHNSSFSNKNNTNSKQESPVLSAAHAYTTPPQTSEEALGSKTIPAKRKLTCPPSTIIRQGEGILLEWNPKKAQQLFGKAPFISVSGISASGWDDIEELGDPDNIYINQADQKKKQLTLSDCLDEFTKEEELSEEDLWYCPKCKKHQMATKKFDLWHMPEILVVHLKRFSHSRTWRDKIDTLIDFPIEELDLTYRVLSVDKETVNEENRLIYDLYAVDNHYGGLGGGHYTAYAQNFEDKNWYHFDDSHVSKIDVADIKTSAAYLLFYKRRRNQGQDVAKTVDEIIQEKNEKQQAAEVKESHESDEMSDDINMLTSKQMSDDENRNDEFKEKKQFV
ncbi:hypothetical protein G6F22_004819 [Rhizopus arrhizus]|nr:hypothetical protein G6F22_004819 [Rhizopus arrhizus]